MSEEPKKVEGTKETPTDVDPEEGRRGSDAGDKPNQDVELEPEWLSDITELEDSLQNSPAALDALGIEAEEKPSEKASEEPAKEPEKADEKVETKPDKEPEKSPELTMYSTVLSAENTPQGPLILAANTLTEAELTNEPTPVGAEK